LEGAGVGGVADGFVAAGGAVVAEAGGFAGVATGDVTTGVSEAVLTAFSTSVVASNSAILHPQKSLFLIIFIVFAFFAYRGILQQSGFKTQILIELLR
jgi:hypothetical protein